ncbi:MAG: cytochrome C [Nitrospirae bacterium CG18_big_fil_WC_8_21_14_2_50_70_55]|nr:cytochrome c [Deltaproteobacteria bacterium]OIP64981.1 MAG: cytochrome C [Nitrospirae bacterium CG2_30_70_394]PIQ04017.1 MAG: cytochrome C [Nitrospirae bacterium CG18_big_fil_WC_8_21_14_2_50_70_55]PIU78629.1 MAG: cytochrome C [Nitrospirae bacterium CG06_land_8_20_14_3_00_70_43]PIW82194.1 MAG: cytochrome C [Nitrospirae bacterium CG_4_8_14_3_um_filter_70_85]PIX83460.1 MAG: cytochrome C [Nitrospirae bacterium CG_4_10_14_3_um_filter_70_108]PJB97308.1 MAG: cytochrome C [Nitrospirae bacterium CG
MEPLWQRESFWRKAAVFVTAGMAVVLLLLTFDSMAKSAVGKGRVPSFAVINQEIDYRFDAGRNMRVPVVAGEQPLFGKRLSEAEAEAMVSHGKKTVQAKNCMDCHTLLGNGAYYAPDLTKAWLDPQWEGMQTLTATDSREAALAAFLEHPSHYPTQERSMPELKITAEEARAVVAFLKWMSAIDTNGFPANFDPHAEEK